MPPRGRSSGPATINEAMLGTLTKTALTQGELLQHYMVENAKKDTRIAELEAALFDLVHLERIQAPDMGGKRRAYAFMQNGEVLADCLDRARALLPYDMQPTNPHHGGKIPS